MVLLFFAMFLGMSVSLNIVQASSEDYGDGSNVGDYVYEDEEYITNGQVDKINAINKRIDTGIYSQKLYVVISKDIGVVGDYHTDGQYRKGITLPDSTVTEDYFHSALDDIEDKQDPDDDDYDADASQRFENKLNRSNNYLIINLEKNQIYFHPSTRGDRYITDFAVWRATFGTKAQMKVGSDESKINAAIRVAERLTPRIQQVSESDTKLKAQTFDDVDRIGYTIIFITIGLIVLISIPYFWGNHSGGSFPGDSGEDTDNYYAGFDEGYYYGSHDPFM